MALALTTDPGRGESARAANAIENFFRVDDTVWTGAQPTVTDLALLSDDGVRTVINLRCPSEHGADEEATAAQELGLRYVNIPVETANPKEEQAEEFLRVLDDPDIFPVFIHCGSGNRVGAFWMIRRIVVDGWHPEDADREARRIGLRSPHLRRFVLQFVARRRGSET